MATPPSSRTPPPAAPMSGGFLLALSVIVGTVAGGLQGQGSIGFVAGLGVGLVLLLGVWLLDRRRAR
jgi:hypothetical protein